MSKLFLGLGLAVLPLFVFAEVYARKVGARMVTRLAVAVKSRCTYANAATPSAHKLTNPNPADQTERLRRDTTFVTTQSSVFGPLIQLVIQ